MPTDNTIDIGTAFPTSPYPGQSFYRSDLNAKFVYLNSTWQQFLPNVGDGELATAKMAIPAATATNTTVKATAGRIRTIVVESTGSTNAMQFTDGAGGPIIMEIAAGVAIGPVPVGDGGQASVSIIAVGNAGNPAVLVDFE